MSEETENILTLKEIKRKLKDKKLYVISKKIGISYPTLKKLSLGIETNYTLHILQKVSIYLNECEKEV